MPHSEVCIHLQVAGTPMDFLFLPSGHAVQLYDAAGREFSFPISAGQAGIYLTYDGSSWYHPPPPAPAGNAPGRRRSGMNPAAARTAGRKSTLHLVQFSAGIGSWPPPSGSPPHTRPRAPGTPVRRHRDRESLPAPFLTDAGRQLGACPTVVADGRTPFQVFADTRRSSARQAGNTVRSTVPRRTSVGSSGGQADAQLTVPVGIA
jgi:hypothetical protein